MIFIEANEKAWEKHVIGMIVEQNKNNENIQIKTILVGPRYSNLDDSDVTCLTKFVFYNNYNSMIINMDHYNEINEVFQKYNVSKVKSQIPFKENNQTWKFKEKIITLDKYKSTLLEEHNLWKALEDNDKLQL